MKKNIIIILNGLLVLSILILIIIIYNNSSSSGIRKPSDYSYLVYTLKNKNEYMVRGNKDFYNGEDIVIPSEYNNLPVTTIEDEAFSGWQSLQNITFPETITHIGRSAFNNSGVTKLTFPEGLERIDDNAFCNCLD